MQPETISLVESLMPLYFFDLQDGRWRPDEIGTELADDVAALVEARRSIAEIMKEQVASDGMGVGLSMFVRRHGGEILLELQMNFSIRPIGAFFEQRAPDPTEHEQS